MLFRSRPIAGPHARGGPTGAQLVVAEHLVDDEGGAGRAATVGQTVEVGSRQEGARRVVRGHDEDGARPRKYYQLTPDGRKRLAEDARTWHRLTTAMGALGLTRALEPAVAP